MIHQLRKHQASHQSWLDHFKADPNHSCGRCTPDVLAGVGDAVEQEVSVRVYDGLIERVTAAQTRLRALEAASRVSRSPELATEISWPQEAAELVQMADEWPLLTDDSGAMFSGDVLIHKLGNALRAALAGARGGSDEGR